MDVNCYEQVGLSKLCNSDMSHAISISSYVEQPVPMHWATKIFYSWVYCIDSNYQVYLCSIDVTDHKVMDKYILTHYEIFKLEFLDEFKDVIKRKRRDIKLDQLI